jgi:predicted nuclease of predicted toxin-antitoxin system
VRLLADLHIAPRTVAFLRSKGHDVVRAGDVLPAAASDAQLVALARIERRTVLTQDLDFSAIVALSGESGPSIISLRLESSRIESVNMRLDQALGMLETEVSRGVLATVEEGRIRTRMLPIS